MLIVIPFPNLDFLQFPDKHRLIYLIIKYLPAAFDANGELIELARDNGIMVSGRQLHECLSQTQPRNFTGT